jgi:NADH-quinone oxidoreductase subunit N
MSSPIIWIVIPAIAAIIMWTFNHKRMATMFSTTGLCIFLTLLAIFMPIDSQINFGGLSFNIGTDLVFFGRRFVLDDSIRPVLGFLYGMGAFWFLGAYFSDAHRYFWPFGMLILSLLVGALAVQPFFYTALIIEVAVLLSIPILYPPGKKISQGGLRYLIFQSLAMPVILFAGWFAAGVEANPGSQSLIFQAVIFLGLGIAFWLAVFPFYSWIPLLLDETHIYSASFIINILSNICLFTIFNLLNSFEWLRSFSQLPEILRLIGGIMVFSGGVWAIFERRLSRLLGYAIILETGMSMIALSLLNRDGYQVFLAMLIPRIIAVAVWTICLVVFFSEELFTVRDLTGVLKRKPFTTISFLIAYMTLGGLPLLAIFPLRFVLYENLAAQSWITAIWVFVGHILFLITGFRLIYQALNFKNIDWNFQEKWPLVILSSIGAFGLFLMGIFPDWLLKISAIIIKSFPHLGF